MESRSQTQVQAGFLLLGCLLSGVMFLYRLLDAGWAAATLVTLLAWLAYSALLIAFRCNLDRGLTADLSLLLLLVVVIGVAINDNGLYSRVMIWLPAVPLIGNFFAGRIRAIGSCLLVIVMLIGLALAHHQGLLARFPALGNEWARLLAFSASTLLVSGTAYLYERNRREADAEKQRLAALHRQWVSVVSHELRTPLTALHGALSLTRHNAESNPERNAEFLAIALRNTERLVRLTNDLLDMERINAGKVLLTRSPSDISQLLEHAASMHQSRADECHITLRVESTVTAPVNIDADRIEQVVHNLLSNALKFSKPDSTVQLRANITHDKRGNDTLHVEVTDTGPGISAELATRLFTPFSQGDGNDSRAHGGFGLGLSICNALIAAHGGQIGFRNGADGGCTFYFEVPLSAV
ncbi:HAMP domain-containing histidine kinase [Permianibacter sp. IMCC34836]|uniref:sensor histidine kinase n=1 Tax=Permianibacter fluminis TaxID=2738515 RepID=UPI0015524051|nr:HAMP domain-containing sensor histidine kinase [Permianibacter fluminis]NQD38083.1 HAMP domain-containing histidine kinase [Permianibacter fluminis]